MISPGKKLREGAVVAVMVILALVALRISAKNPGELSTLDRGILAVVAPAQAALSTVARAIGGVLGRYAELTHVRSENDRLRSENTRLRAELMQTKRVAAESGRYQSLLGLKNTTPAETLAARVISIDASPYFRVARVEIDRGGGLVRRGMPVLTPDGVVGRINRVSGQTSDILLAVDARSSIDVFLPRTGGRGVLRGRAGENGYRCSVEYLMRGEQAREGDLVVTSGLGGAFPRDLAVGKVTRVVPNPSGLYQEVEVTPDVDFARLSEVLIVVAAPPTPDPDAATPPARKPPPLPAHGPTVYR
ncbi:MAG: rod shape-determining protein MreC [Deltaproteobacteria bacterium]|nr:rod shape-determining protein MreC [Deltaproteobacteria bacterium]